jgi:hypothetical protein
LLESNSVLHLLFIRPRIVLSSLNGQKSQTEILEAQQYIKAINLMSWKILKFIAVVSIATYLGSLSIINYSLALIITIIYTPVCLILTRSDRWITASLKMLLALLICPFICLLGVYFAYSTVFLDNFYGDLATKLYSQYSMSKISNIWTYDLICVGLYPIWLLFWCLVVPRK